MQHRNSTKLLRSNPWKDELLTYGEEVKDERSEPKGILDDSPYLAIIRHGRLIQRFGRISLFKPNLCSKKWWRYSEKIGLSKLYYVLLIILVFILNAAGFFGGSVTFGPFHMYPPIDM